MQVASPSLEGGQRSAVGPRHSDSVRLADFVHRRAASAVSDLSLFHQHSSLHIANQRALEVNTSYRAIGGQHEVELSPLHIHSQGSIKDAHRAHDVQYINLSFHYILNTHHIITLLTELPRET